MYCTISYIAVLFGQVFSHAGTAIPALVYLQAGQNNSFSDKAPWIIGIISLAAFLTALVIALVTGRYSVKIIKKAQGVTVDEAVVAAGYEYDAGQDMFYSIMNPWQRKYGYCKIYDEAAAPLGMIIDCEPVHFEYQGRKWLIEFWKGQYDLTTGCEIGIYTDPVEFQIPGVQIGSFYSSCGSIVINQLLQCIAIWIIYN
jgi:hypothetical protein